MQGAFQGETHGPSALEFLHPFQPIPAPVFRRRGHGLCYRERTAAGETTDELRYFIGSKRAGARYYGRALRGHWRIENGLHWQLDVTFREDACRVRQRRAAENLATVRRFALSVLKRSPAAGSIATKQMEAALDVGFLEELLRGSHDG
jgi:predicted transposase YbfD/YdcC